MPFLFGGSSIAKSGTSALCFAVLAALPDIAAAREMLQKPDREMADDRAASGPYRIATPQRTIIAKETSR
jgi:hypothetical protein